MAAAVRRKGEGIALLSVYADEDEEDADMEDEEEDEVMLDAVPEAEPTRVEVVQQQQPVAQRQHEEDRVGNGGAVAVGAGVRRGRRGIVDYAHDEAALSPEPEGREQDDGGSEAGIVYHQWDAGNGVLEEEVRRSPAAAAAAGTVSQGEAVAGVDDAGKEGEGLAAAGERAPGVEPAADGKAGDETSLLDAEAELDDFLPPPPTGKCSEELQSKFAKYLALKNSGRSFNEELRNSKGYRNPDFLQRAVRYQEIDQIGSCFKKEVFDPHGYDPADFYDAISAELKELKRKEQEKKQSQRIDFVRGTVASVPAMPDGRPKPMVQLLAGQKGFPGAGAAVQSSFRASSSATVVGINGEASVKTEGRSKKTKWDRVDEDKCGMPIQMGAKDALAAATAAAAAASASSARLAATAGSGYSNTWLPKRRETDDKSKSSEKTSSSSRSDRRVDKQGESRRTFE